MVNRIISGLFQLILNVSGRKTQEFRLTILRALYDEGGKLDWKVPDPSFEQEMENLNLDS